MDIPSLRPETLYGMPAADQILFNRFYVLGYSYYFRQAKWALEIVDSQSRPRVDREDHFRPDHRIPEMFRADLVDYRGSGYHRGHLIPSADQRGTKLQNSETFLLSNMSPQHPKFNRGIWSKLEQAIRQLDGLKATLATYVICGPIFDFNEKVKSIGEGDGNRVSIPIPNMYFKSVLRETRTGRLYMWSFLIPNGPWSEGFEAFQVSTERVERYAGIKLWERLVGKK